MRTIGIYLSILALFTLCVGRANAQYIDTICAGEQGVRYYTGARQGSTFSWAVSDGTIDSTSADGAQIWVNWDYSDGVKKIAVIETTDDGCSGDTVEALVLALPLGEVDIFGPDAVCNGETVELKAEGAESYLWSTGATTDVVKVKPEVDTTFSVIGYFGECGTKTSLHDLRVQYRPKADFEYLPEQPIINTPIQFQYTGTNNVDTWNWTFKEQKNPEEYSSFINPEYTVRSAGLLRAHLMVKNDFGCFDSITKYIPIEAGIKVFIASGFTPNGDGFNNIFIPHYENVSSTEFVVFNRWGEIMFKTLSLTEGWDGSYKGKPVPDGVYAFLVNATGFDDKLYTYKGTITVLR